MKSESLYLPKLVVACRADDYYIQSGHSEIMHMKFN